MTILTKLVCEAIYQWGYRADYDQVYSHTADGSNQSGHVCGRFWNPLRD